jgi:peptidoglycan/LPS O-acetylase OafA/YrhL
MTFMLLHFTILGLTLLTKWCEVAASSPSSTCVSDYLNIITASSNNSEAQVVLYSSHINTYVGYDACINVNNFSVHFCTMDIVTPQLYVESYGLCLPSSCSADVMTEALSSIPIPGLPFNVSVLNIGGINCYTNHDMPESGIVVEWITFVSLILIIGLYILHDWKIFNLHFYNIADGWKWCFNPSFTHKKVNLQINNPPPPVPSVSINTVIDTEEDKLRIFNGLKVITYIAIVGFNVTMYTCSWLWDFSDLTDLLNFKRVDGYVAYSFQFGYDTAFFICGFFAFRRIFKDKVHYIQGPVNVIRRWIKLGPLIGTVVCWYMYVIQYKIQSPMIPKIPDSNCDANWGYSIGLIQTFISPNKMCLPHLWYPSAEFFMIVITGLIVAPVYWYHKRSGLICTVLLMCLGYILQIYDTVQSPYIYPIYDDSYHIYFTFWTRMGPFFLGMLLSIKFDSCRGKFAEVTDRSKLILKGIRWLCLGIILTVPLLPMIYMSHPNVSLSSSEISLGWNQSQLTAYNVISRISVTIATVVIIITSWYVSDGYIVNFLKSNKFVFLSKLSYNIYVIHPIVCIIYISSLRGPYQFNITMLIYLIISTYTISICFGMITYMFLQYPIKEINRLILTTMIDYYVPGDNSYRYNSVGEF